MITREDLEAAIAECVGQREPNAQTCIKLAAYYTIRDAMYPVAEPARDMPQYSFAAAPERPTAHIDSSTEFAQAVEGLPLEDVWGVVDELMSAVMISQPRLYRSVLRRLRQL